MEKSLLLLPRHIYGHDVTKLLQGVPYQFIGYFINLLLAQDDLLLISHDV
jgi:hypothetical protein